MTERVSKIFVALPLSVRTCKLFAYRGVFFSHQGKLYLDSNHVDEAESELDPKDKERIKLATKGYERNHGELDHEEDQDDVQEVRRRTEPLSLLNNFVPWRMNDTSSDDILAVFDHCPNIEHLDVHCGLHVGDELESLARSIKERCLHSRTLSSKNSLDCRHLFLSHGIITTPAAPEGQNR